MTRTYECCACKQKFSRAHENKDPCPNRKCFSLYYVWTNFEKFVLDGSEVLR